MKVGKGFSIYYIIGIMGQYSGGACSSETGSVATISCAQRTGVTFVCMSIYLFM
jgi:hypothetical protein